MSVCLEQWFNPSVACSCAQVIDLVMWDYRFLAEGLRDGGKNTRCQVMEQQAAESQLLHSLNIHTGLHLESSLEHTGFVLTGPV